MGLALAEAAAAAGARVSVVLGPVERSIAAAFRRAAVDVVEVETAREMARAAIPRFRRCGVAFFAAAVADFRPWRRVRGKIGKRRALADGRGRFSLTLVPNPDILWSCGRVKREGQILVGFALESADAERRARGKLREKNLDFVVCNAPSALNAARSDVTVHFRDGGRLRLRGTKAAIGKRLIGLALERWQRRPQAKRTPTQNP